MTKITRFYITTTDQDYFCASNGWGKHGLRIHPFVLNPDGDYKGCVDVSSDNGFGSVKAFEKILNKDPSVRIEFSHELKTN